MIHAVISGTGSYLPSKVLTNQALESQLDTTHEWIYSRTGIARRHIAERHETGSFMAKESAIIALEAANLAADDIDMIIVATCTPDNFFPMTACQVQYDLNIKKPIPAFDVSAACSGFIYVLDIARQYIATGSAKHILVIGSEVMSKAVNWQDRGSCVLFGDGAGAMVLSASTKPGILASIIHAQHDKDLYLYYPNLLASPDGKKISMQGSEVFKLAVNIMGGIVDEVLEKAGLKQEDIDWLVPHQANIRIINAIAKKLNLPLSRVVTTIEDQGNTSAGSIPLALDTAIRQGMIKRGDKLLLESFGAGLTWGAVVVQY